MDHEPDPGPTWQLITLTLPVYTEIKIFGKCNQELTDTAPQQLVNKPLFPVVAVWL